MTYPADGTSSGPTSTGLPANVAGALSYVLGPITGVIFYILEKNNRFVRFHAAQSIVVWLTMLLLTLVLSFFGTVLAFIPIIGWIITSLLSFGLTVVSFVLWIFLMWQAFQGNEWEAPFAGVFARRMID